MRKSLLSALLILAAPTWATDYVQASGSALAFAGKYQGAVFVGQFPGFSTTVSFDPAAPEKGKLNVTIPMLSATTRNKDYDSEMLAAAFFNATAFPQATFQANGFRAMGDNRYAADGTLTLRGISKPVTFEFTWTPGERPVLRGRAAVKRLDFDVGAGDWADTKLIPNAIAVSTRVVLTPAK